MKSNAPRPITADMVDLSAFNLHFVSSADADCWSWAGRRDPHGYGKFQLTGVYRGPVFAHRVAFVLANGEIPAGLVVDHLCRNTSCVNPSHLEAVPTAVNILRGQGAPARHARVTHCPQGHEYAPENTRRRADGRRSCLACHPQRKPGRPRQSSS